MTQRQVALHLPARTGIRIRTIAGIVLIVAGVSVLLAEGTFVTGRVAPAIGDMTLSSAEQHPFRPWIAGFAVVAGMALAATGLRRRA